MQSALPSEVLAQVFCLLETTDIFSAMTVSRVFYEHALSLVYFSVRHIRLFGSGEDEDAASMQCLRTLASSDGPALATRHFSVRGLPWQTPATIALLAQALSRMRNLVSLELDGGIGLETDLLPTLSPDVLPSLQAACVAGHEIALFLLERRPISNLRLSALHTSADVSLVLEKAKASDVPIRHFQAVVQVASVDVISEILEKLDTGVRAVSIEFRLQAASPANVSEGIREQIASSLSRLHALNSLSLVTSPSPAAQCPEEDAKIANSIVRHCQALSALDLQWNSWRVANSAVVEATHQRRAVLCPKWSYTVRQLSAATDILQTITMKRRRSLGLEDATFASDVLSPVTGEVPRVILPSMRCNGKQTYSIRL